MSKIDEVRQRLEDIKSRMVEINEEYDGVALPEELRSEFETLQTEKDDTVRLIEELEVRSAWVKDNAQDESRTERLGDGLQVRRPGSVSGNDIWDLSTLRSSPLSDSDELRTEVLDRSKRAIETMQVPHPRITRERAQEHVSGLIERNEEAARLVLLTGSPLYQRAFRKTILEKPVTQEEQRALSLAGSGGGFAIPYTLDPTIIPTSNSSVNPWRAISRVETISGSNEWRGVSSAGVTASRQTEATEATDNAPTLAQPTATVTKAHVFVPYSIEVGQDWGSLESELASLIQDSKDDEEATAFATGSGAGVNPQGVVTGTTNTVAAASGLTVTAANLYALENALPPRFRPNETFVANRGIYNVVRGIDTSGGAALWLYISEGLNNQVPSPGNTGALLLGRPAYESSAMQATVVNATKIMIVGDFRYFLIVDRVGLTVELIPHLFGATNRYPTGQRGLYAYWRNTSKVLDANAFRALTGTT